MLLGSHDKCPLQVAGSGVVCLEDLCILNSGTPNVCQSDFKKTWTNSYEFVPIPKKGNAKECSNYRTIAWRIPWTEEPGRLQSMGSQRDTTE